MPTPSPVADRPILVVEGEATLAGSAAARLRKERFDVEVVGEGRAAAERAHELSPDLLQPHRELLDEPDP